MVEGLYRLACRRRNLVCWQGWGIRKRGRERHRRWRSFGVVQLSPGIALKRPTTLVPGVLCRRGWLMRVWGPRTRNVCLSVYFVS